MEKSIFTKRWDTEHGFTQEEAEEKKRKVDDAHGVYSSNPKWKPAQLVKDHTKKDGYMVVIETI